MEFFRWILILTGIVLLAAAFMINRSKKPKRAARRAKRVNSITPAAYDPSLDELPVPVDDPLDDRATVEVAGDSAGHHLSYADDDTYISDEQIEYSRDNFHTDPQYGNRDRSEVVATENFEDIDLALDGHNDTPAKVTTFASAVKAANAQEQLSGDFEVHDDYDQGFAGEFEAYSEPVELDDFEEKLVAVNVVALSGRRFYGKDLKSLFDKHGYTFGRMSLYHCSLEGDKVFSIANMVKPGIFDEEQMRTFETPGITLFMRLPIDLDSDVAFDFFIREATELAEELGGQLRDGNRNPLSEQTIQHMREDIQQYVFRTKRVLQPTT